MYPEGAPLLSPGKKMTQIQDGYQLGTKNGGMLKFYNTGSLHVAGKEPGRTEALKLVEPWTEINPVAPRKRRKRGGP